MRIMPRAWGVARIRSATWYPLRPGRPTSMHEGQANAETALLALDRAAALHEEIEHVRQQIARDADAGVSYADHGLPIVLPHRHLDASAFGRVLQRVAEQVVDDLVQAHLVG